MLRVTFQGLWARKRRMTGAFVAIALGVAFLAGALSLGDTLSANFNQLFTSANAGTDVVVRNATTVGNGIDAQRPTLPASLVSTIAQVPGVAGAQPNIVGYGGLVGHDGTIVGGMGPPRIASNWVTDPALNPYRLVSGRAPRADDEVIINKGAADSGKLRLGDTTTVEMPAPVRVRIVGIATFGTASGLGTATFTAFDLHGAQRYIVGGHDTVSSILVDASPGIAQSTLAARIQTVLPTGATAATGAAVTQQNINDLSSAFLTVLRTFLVVFAGIALLVATFSIANTFSILVAQRTREEALLRTLGASRRQILRAVVIEAVVVGLVASAVGVVAGFGIAGLLKGLFDAVGFALPAGGLVVKASTIALSLAVGVVVTVVAGLLPARRASRVAPIAALRETAAESVTVPRRRAVIGAILVVLGGAGVILAVRGSGNGVLGRVGIGALATAIGVIVAIPAIARPVLGAIGLPLTRSRGGDGALARDNVTRNPRRSAAAASALLIGVAVATLFTTFAASLKTAVTTDVNHSFTGDIAVSSGGFGGGVAPELATAIARLPGVETATGVASGQVRIGTSSQKVSVIDPGRIGAVLDLHPTAGSITTLPRDGIALSSHEADAKHWHMGTRLAVTLPDGSHTVATVDAIYSSRDLAGDYVLPSAAWVGHSTQDVDTNILVKLAKGANESDTQHEIEKVAAAYGKPDVQGHAAFVDAAARPVNYILGIVYVLLALAVIIALFGIANTLSLSIYERTREIGLLRAVGQTRRQLRRTIRFESVIVAVSGTLGGMALGTFLGWGLAEAARKAQGIAIFTVPFAQLVVILVVGAIAGLLAAYRPARRAARLDVLTAISQE